MGCVSCAQATTANDKNSTAVKNFRIESTLINTMQSWLVGNLAGKLYFPAQIVVDVAIFLVLHGNQSCKVLTAQFLHHLWNFPDAFAQQHIHFPTARLNILQMDKFQP